VTDEALLGALYEGPLEDPPWSAFLDALCRRLGLVAASWIVRGGAEMGLGLLLSRGLRRHEGVYRERYFARDPFVNLPEGEVVTLADLVPEAELSASDFFRHFLEPAGVLHVMGVDLREDGVEARLRLSRGRDAGPFAGGERAALAALVPHLRRALRLFVRITRAQGERDAYASTIDQLAIGALLLDAEGRVLSRNEASARLTREGNGVDVREGRPCASDAAETRRLREAIARSLAGRAAGAPALVEALQLRGKDGDAVGVLIRALPEQPAAPGRAAPALALFHGDPHRREPISSEVVRGLFGLTPAEASLATQLAAGLTLDEAAEALDIARNTARAHLRAIFDKAGVTRQADLVRLILRSVATLG
jgi:DNA-binding CsgD family transcriptional regulator/PAS domain-containing protein